MVPRLNSSQEASFLVLKSMNYEKLKEYVPLKIRTLKYGQTHVLNGGRTVSVPESHMLLNPSERTKFKIEAQAASADAVGHTEQDVTKKDDRIIKYRYSPGRIARFRIEVTEDGGSRTVQEDQALYEGEYVRYQIPELDSQD